MENKDIQWITKGGKHIPISEYVDKEPNKERQIEENKKQADMKEIEPLIRKATSSPSDLLQSERKQLEEYVDKYGSNQGTIYRGLDLPDYAVKNLKVGEEFKMQDRLTSFTPDKSSAEEFAKRHLRDFSRFGNNAVILKEEEGFGINISAMSKFENENEVLVNNKGNYIIKKVQKTKGKNPGYHGQLENVDIWIITVERKK